MAQASISSRSWKSPAGGKDIDEVVATCQQAGLARRIARLRPVGVIKG